jgi:hypothetical protein
LTGPDPWASELVFLTAKKFFQEAMFQFVSVEDSCVRGVDLISDALPFGGLWHGEPDAISNAIGSAKFYSRPALLAFPL